MKYSCAIYQKVCCVTAAIPAGAVDSAVDGAATAVEGEQRELQKVMYMKREIKILSWHPRNCSHPCVLHTSSSCRQAVYFIFTVLQFSE